MPPKDKREKKVLKGALAGGIAGGLEVLFTYPTDFIKTQLQLDRFEKKYDGTLDCIRKTIKRHGFFGLYRGMSILLLGSIAKVASRFGAYEFYTLELQEEDGSHTILKTFLSGLLAGATEAVVAVTPLETIKLKIMNDMHRTRPRYNGLFHGVRCILRREGIRGIYRGLSATVLKQGTNQAIRFFLMVTQKDLYAGTDSAVIVPMPLIGIFGVISGAASVLGNTPIDVIKTRMQGFKSIKNKSAMECATEILRKEGAGAFFKGSVMRMARVCIDVALTFMIYDSLMEYVFANLWT
ncbi:hypothetical protein ACLKA7_009413 [Drosophila subpalustris]